MTFSDTVLSLSPTAYWRFSETSGANVADSSGNGYNLTCEGSYTRNTESLVPNSTDPSITFNNAGYARSTEINAFNFEHLSVVMVVKPNELNNDVLFHLGNWGQYGEWGIYMGLMGTGSTYVGWMAPEGWKNESTADGVLSVGNTYLIVWCYSETIENKVKIAVNGSVLKDVVPQFSNYGTIKTPVTIGAGWSGAANNECAAVIDEVAVFPGILTDNQISALYSAFTNTIVFGISGTVRLNGIYKMAPIIALASSTNEKAGETLSNPTTGEYTISGLIEGESYYILCLPPAEGVRPLVHGPISPVEIM